MAQIPDVQRGNHLFSDGVGRVSVELAQGMAARLARLGRCPVSHVPSAFQIRYAGAKGIITVHPPLQGKRYAPILQGGLANMSVYSYPEGHAQQEYIDSRAWRQIAEA